MAIEPDEPDCFICSIRVSICLTIRFCLACVSSPGLGLAQALLDLSHLLDELAHRAAALLLLGPVLLPFLAGELLEPLVELLVLALQARLLGPVLGFLLVFAAAAPEGRVRTARRAGDDPGRLVLGSWLILGLAQLLEQLVELLVLGRHVAGARLRSHRGLRRLGAAGVWASGFAVGTRSLRLGLLARADSTPRQAWLSCQARPASRSANREPRPCPWQRRAPGPRPRRTRPKATPAQRPESHARFGIRIMIIPLRRLVWAWSGRGRGRPGPPGPSRADRPRWSVPA